jgi:hypothetical protein
MEIKISISRAITLSAKLGPLINLMKTRITEIPKIGIITK